jgi:hypothetical protein
MLNQPVASDCQEQAVQRFDRAFDKHPMNPHQNKVGPAPSQSAQEAEQEEQDYEITR